MTSLHFFFSSSFSQETAGGGRDEVAFFLATKDEVKDRRTDRWKEGPEPHDCITLLIQAPLCLPPSLPVACPTFSFSGIDRMPVPSCSHLSPFGERITLAQGCADSRRAGLGLTPRHPLSFVREGADTRRGPCKCHESKMHTHCSEPGRLFLTDLLDDSILLACQIHKNTHEQQDT